MRPSPSLEALMSAANNPASGSIVVEIHDGGDFDPQGAANPAALSASIVSVVYRCCDLTFSMSAMLAMQLMYYKTWADECDIELKVWSTGWLGLQTLRSFMRLAQTLLLRYTNPRTSSKWMSFLSTTLVDLASFAWFLYGIFPIFVDRDPKCNKASQVWSLVGWSMQAFVYFFPCLVIIICVPAFVTIMAMPAFRDTMFPVIFGTRRESTNQQPTPDELLSKLEPLTFAEAVSSDLIDLEQRRMTPPAHPTERGPGGGTAVGDGTLQPPSAGGPPDGGAVPNLITASLPETLSHAMNSILTRLGSQSELIPPTAGTISAGQPGGYYHSPRGYLTCPICVMEFEPEDEILRLPCDPRHHVYHRSCIVEWLKKSQHCPMCRNNIAQMLRDLEPPEAGNERRSGGSSSSLHHQAEGNSSSQQPHHSRII